MYKILFQEFDDLLNEDRLTRVPTLVYANKQDLETAESRYIFLWFEIIIYES